MSPFLPLGRRTHRCRRRHPVGRPEGRPRWILARRVPPVAPQPHGLDRRGHRPALRPGRRARALIAPYPETALPGAKFITPTHIPGPGELPEFPLGLDRFRWRRAVETHLGSTGLAAHRCDLDRSRPGGRHDPRPPRRNLRRLGRHAHHAHRRHHPVGAEPAARGVHRRDPRADTVRGDDRDRCLPGADLRATVAGIDAAAALQRLRALGPDPRSRSRVPSPCRTCSQTPSTRDRAGDPDARDRRDRCGGAVVPRSRRRAPGDGGVGAACSPTRKRSWRSPWLAFLPGICIAVTALDSLFGEALREAMDPRTRAR